MPSSSAALLKLAEFLIATTRSVAVSISGSDVATRFTHKRSSSVKQSPEAFSIARASLAYALMIAGTSVARSLSGGTWMGLGPAKKALLSQ
jgi:hypothetical protein